MGDTAVVATLANAPAKLRPVTAIIVKSIAAIIVFHFISSQVSEYSIFRS